MNSHCEQITCWCRNVYTPPTSTSTIHQGYVDEGVRLAGIYANSEATR